MPLAKRPEPLPTWPGSPVSHNSELEPGGAQHGSSYRVESILDFGRTVQRDAKRSILCTAAGGLQRETGT